MPRFIAKVVSTWFFWNLEERYANGQLWNKSSKVFNI